MRERKKNAHLSCVQRKTTEVSIRYLWIHIYRIGRTNSKKERKKKAPRRDATAPQYISSTPSQLLLTDNVLTQSYLMKLISGLCRMEGAVWLSLSISNWKHETKSKLTCSHAHRHAMPSRPFLVPSESQKPYGRLQLSLPQLLSRLPMPLSLHIPLAYEYNFSSRQPSPPCRTCEVKTWVPLG